MELTELLPILMFAALAILPGLRALLGQGP